MTEHPPAEYPGVEYPPAGRPEVEYLLAGSLWWAGRPRSGEALRVGGDGCAVPVPLADVPAEAPKRRLPGTLLPGLTDAHVHSGLVDLATVRAGGIAAVWDLGSVPSRVAGLAHRPGFPRIRYAGPFLTAPGGYPSDRGWAAPGSWREVGSAADATAAVAEAHAAGAALIKVTAHAGGPRPDAVTLAAVVDAAHALHLPVAVHAEGPGTVAAAYEAGADILAHTPWTEPLDPGLVRACAGRMCWISTLDIHGWGTPTPELGTAIGNLRRFREYGGSVRYGTDLGNGPLPPGVNAREIRALQAAGLPPADILRAMTGGDTTAGNTATSNATTSHTMTDDTATSNANTRDTSNTSNTATSNAMTRNAATGNAASSDPVMGDAGTGVTWLPGGLDLEPSRFADVLATARVLDETVRPRG